MQTQDDILMRAFQAIDAVFGAPKNIPQVPPAEEPRPCPAISIPPQQAPPVTASNADLEPEERRCYFHADKAEWWERPHHNSWVCGRCHPDPRELAAQRAHRQAVAEAQEAESPPMPPGVTLLEYRPATPPVSICAWMVVNDVSQFIRTTVAQLDAALRGESWRAGNWSVRDLVERLEQVGVKVQVTP